MLKLKFPVKQLNSKVSRKQLFLFLKIAWVLCFGLLIFICLYPVSMSLTRFITAGCVVFCWLAGVVILWKFYRIGMIVLGSGILLLVAVFLLPGRNADSGNLRRSYCESLRGFDGCRFIWGGENFLGIDCSGLIRKAMIKNLIKQGIVTFNPGLIRQGLKLWVRDFSARDFLKEKAPVIQIAEAEKLNNFDHSELLPGDLAVTRSGAHIMAYLGNQEWIEADPGILKVITVKLPAENSWFNIPVKIMRWNWPRLSR